MTQRYYSLYEKLGRRWVRVTGMAFELSLARRVFQTALINQQTLRLDSTATTGELMLRAVPKGGK